ncbi:MAG: PA14 domain-containing protein [Candidatus Omnitrophica bacterium]|nr:PA14 domain-containing protein [Candidatus Omnitrophota bacterium]
MKKLFLILFFCFILYSEEFQVTPYVDKNQYIKRWPDSSFYKQPWRSYLETISGKDFLNGLGIGFYLTGNRDDDSVLKFLSYCGFKNIRIEIGFVNVNWDETGLYGVHNKKEHEERFKNLFLSCKKYGIKPLILLNAHHGHPCPMKYIDGEVLEDAQTGSRELKFKVIKGEIKENYTALTNIRRNPYRFLDIFITKYDGEKAILSRPLPDDLKKGEKIILRTYKYLPLHPVGTSEFEETAKGWIKYVKLICELAKNAGLEDKDFEIEIWNELTFGSAYMSGINSYYDPPKTEFKIDFLRPGGHAWELAKRTVDYIKENFPNTRVIWGFSNTTFFRTPINNLPSKIDGQSYHPYGTGKRVVSKDYPPKDRYGHYIEGYIPDELNWCMPEGWAHLQVQCETLIHHLNPDSRKTKPIDVERFYHYMTEHGFSGYEAKIEDEQEALLYKAKSLIRALMFWINKGISKIYIYTDYDKDNKGFGLLNSKIPLSEYKNYKEEELLTPALKSLKNIVDKFKDSEDLKSVRQIDVEVVSIGKQYKVFEKVKYIGKETTPPEPPELYYRDMFVFLPFQVNRNKFIFGVYVMSYDITNPPPPMKFRLNIKNINGKDANIKYYDPIIDKEEKIEIIEKEKNSVEVEIEAVEYPRLIIIEETLKPLIIEEFEVKDITKDKAILLVKTSEPAKIEVIYSIYNYKEKISSNKYSRLSEINLSNLLPRQTYEFEIVAEDRNGIKVKYPSFIWEPKPKFTTKDEKAEPIGLLTEYYISKNFGEFTELKKTEISPFIYVDNSILNEKLKVNEMVAVRWTGQIFIEKDDKYIFYTISDDGIRIKIDDKIVINNWTTHAPKEDIGEIELNKGWHKILIEYFQGRGGCLLEVYYSSSDFEKKTIPPKFLKP